MWLISKKTVLCIIDLEYWNAAHFGIFTTPIDIESNITHITRSTLQVRYFLSARLIVSLFLFNSTFQLFNFFASTFFVVIS